MYRKKFEIKIRELKMFTILLFTLISFFILDYSFIYNAEQTYSENLTASSFGSEEEHKYKKRLKTQRNYILLYDKLTFSDSALKNVFVAFKFFQDDDNTDDSLFSKLKDGPELKGFHEIVRNIYQDSFPVKLWYRLIVWEIILVIFLESVSISVKNIIYIHKSDGKKGLNVSTC